MDINEIYDGLSLRIDKNRIKINAPMKDYTSFKAGGSAAMLVEPQDREELAFSLRLLTENEVEHMVIGNGSDLLVRDSGYRGVILRISGGEFSDCKVDGQRLIAGAGVLLSSASRAACEASLAGFEFASGIPGTIGGAVFMNAGAYDGEISHVIESAEILSKDGSRVFTMSKEEMELSYRHSFLQNTGDVLLKAVFLLKEGEKDAIADRIRELTAKRTEKQPLSYPSAGSFFKRPQGNFAGKLIQDAGLSGLAVGGAQVSPLHAGFIVNTGGATATNIIDLMEIIRSTVFEESGVLLEPEVRIIGD